MMLNKCVKKMSSAFTYEIQTKYANFIKYMRVFTILTRFFAIDIKAPRKI